MKIPWGPLHRDGDSRFFDLDGPFFVVVVKQSFFTSQTEGRPPRAQSQTESAFWGRALPALGVPPFFFGPPSSALARMNQLGNREMLVPKPRGSPIVPRQLNGLKGN